MFDSESTSEKSMDLAEESNDEDLDDVEPDSDVEDTRPTSDRVQRAEYVGRGNVQTVRAARKQVGLSETFPRGDPLLVEFAEFLRVAGAAPNNIRNKVILIDIRLNWIKFCIVLNSASDVKNC